MPLNLDPLRLDVDPASVHRAREWVRQVLSRLRRHDLVDAAELGVSELVTNAILHGTPPISVRVRGTHAHPRVEVRDGSKRPPSVNVEMADGEHLMSTVGRGVGLVALHSATWGAELVEDGKVVWFEPVSRPRVDSDLSGQVFDLHQTVQERLDEAGVDGAPLRIELLDLPVAPYLLLRRRFDELGRELRLLALAHGNDYPVAKELTDVFLQVEQERRLTHGFGRVDEAVAEQRDRVDLELLVPPTAPGTMVRLSDTWERADRFCRDQHLLSLAASPQQLALQRWYLSEFSRQADGEPPLPWKGSFDVVDGPRT